MRPWWPFAGLVVLAFAAATYAQADADLWGHLRFGLDTLQTHRLTSVDPYSFTQDVPWVNHEWLSELQMALAYRLGGVGGLALLKGALIFVAFVLIWRATSGARLWARVGVIVLAWAGTINVTANLRPQDWSFLFLAVLLRLLAGQSAGVRWWLLPLFAVWANCHGGWFVGLGVLVVWAGASALSDRTGLRDWLPLIAFCALATLCNPYGIGLWEFLLRTVRPQRSIQEWLPVLKSGAVNWIPWVGGVAAVLAAAFRPQPARLARLAVLAVLAGATFRVMRVGPLFIEAAALLLAPAVVARWPAGAQQPLAIKTVAERVVAALLLAAPIAAAAWAFSFTLTCIRIHGPWIPDAEPARLLASAQPGRLVTFFDWGEYALWHLSPRLRVSMDGRRETIYSDARLAEHEAIVAGTPAGLETLDTWQPEYVWLQAKSTATKQWLAARGYRIEFESPRSFVAVRGDLPHLSAPPSAPRPDRRCFPE